MNPLENILNFIKGLGGSSTYHYDFRPPTAQAAQAAQAVASPATSPMGAAQALATTPSPTQMPQPSATPISVPQDQLRQNIANTWGADTPLLNNLDTYIKAGNQLPGNMEKLLPLALALRETQGGKDLLHRNFGQNNPYNIRGIQNGKTQFINYPSDDVATSGGGPDNSQGLVNLLGQNPAYADFRQSNNYADLFKHWSPTSDNNGASAEQIQNINWILNQIRQGHQ